MQHDGRLGRELEARELAEILDAQADDDRDLLAEFDGTAADGSESTALTERA